MGAMRNCNTISCETSKTQIHVNFFLNKVAKSCKKASETPTSHLRSFFFCGSKRPMMIHSFHSFKSRPKQRQLLLDREMSRDGLLMGGTTMSLAWSSEGSFPKKCFEH